MLMYLHIHSAFSTFFALSYVQEVRYAGFAGAKTGQNKSELP